MEPSTEAIQSAISSGEFRRALVLWEIHADALAKRARPGGFESRQLAELAALIDWTRKAVLIARTQAQQTILRRRAACSIAQTYITQSHE